MIVLDKTGGGIMMKINQISGILRIFMNDILIVSPHVDDETLGAGGTLLRQKAAGAKLFQLNITDMSMNYGYEAEDVKQKRRQLEKVRASYQMDDFLNLELCPGKLDSYSFSDVAGKIREFLLNTKPDTLIIPWPYDIHSDHRIVSEWMMPFTKSFRYDFIKTVLYMEIVSETDFGVYERAFKPNLYVDISDYLANKIDIMNIYKNEIKAHPFPRSKESITAKAILNGAVAGVKYAEAFRIIKKII